MAVSGKIQMTPADDAIRTVALVEGKSLVVDLYNISRELEKVGTGLVKVLEFLISFDANINKEAPSQ